MSRLTFRRPSPAFVISVVALFAAMGGVGFAEQAVTSAVKKFHGKRIKNRTVSGKKIKAGTLRFTHFRAGELLRPSDAYGKAESDSRYQPRGSYQPAGDYLAADGKAADADRLDGRDSSEFASRADSMWAFVAADGTLVRSSGGVTSQRSGLGRYEVSFPRAVDACSYTATNSSTDGGEPAPGQIGAGLLAGADTVGVSTGDNAGALSDDEFMLHVLC